MKTKINVYHTDRIREHDYGVQWNIYPKLLKKIKLDKKDKILDAGCGKGELAKYLGDYKLYGFDFDEWAVKKAMKENYKKVIQSDINQITYSYKKFDKTISIQVFPYIFNPDKAFKELIRVTKKEIIISVPNFNWFKLKSLFSKKWNKLYNKHFEAHTNKTNSKFLKNLAKRNNLKLKIFYLSNKWERIRNLFGSYLASEVVGIFKIK